jgi:hypothetical protein
MLVLMVVCALFAVPIMLGLVVIGAELAWAIVSLPFRLLAVAWHASKSAAHWIARRLPSIG